MIALPPALASWGPHLSLFPDDLAAALAPLAQRLNAALGPMRTHDQRDEGDPDGFSDIGRRGPYDRLLLSEWLLADDAPDEFLRRAAMGEHGFLQLARRARTGGRTSFALFDAGPSQLGGPRIAHLALLIVLARRAEAAKARFEWAILQKPDQEPTAGLTEINIRTLLAARTAQAPTAQMWEQWRSRMAAQSDIDDFWAIGGDRLVQYAAQNGAASVEVCDEFDPEINRISVRIHQPHRAHGHAILDLPADPLCARLLRDPFSVATAAPTHIPFHAAPASNILFTTNGSKAIARAQSGGLIAYPVPNSPNAGPGYPKRYTLPILASNPILAAGRFKKAYVTITRPGNGDTLLVSCIGGKNTQVPVGDYTLRPSQVLALDRLSDFPLTLCLPVCADDIQKGLIAALPSGEIVRLERSRNDKTITTLAAHADFLAPPAAGNTLVYGYRSANKWHIRSISPQNGEQLLDHDYDASSESAVFSGYPANLGHPNLGLIALHSTAHRWRVLTRKGDVWLNAIPECQVVGVIATRRYETPALALLEPGARRIRLLSTSWSHLSPITNAPIEHVAVSPTAPLIAYSTTEGEMIIYSLEHEAIVYRLTPEGSSE